MNEYLPYAITAVFSVIGYLLNRKDAQQEAQIKEIKDLLAAERKTSQEELAAVKKECKETSELLFKKHDIDANNLQELRVHIAEGHYKKTELDSKFERLEFAFKLGFDDLGRKFDKLSEALMSHVTKDDKK